MTTLRQAAQQALEALTYIYTETTADEDELIDQAITAIKEALAQPEQQAEPVSHAVIAGALFDFMGWLTTRDERLVLSGADEAGPAVEAITAFAKMRGLSLDDAKVQDWQNYTAPPQQQAETPPEWPLIKNILAEYGLDAIAFVAEFKAAQRKPLTEEQIVDIRRKTKPTGHEAWADTISFARAIEAAHNIKEQP